MSETFKKAKKMYEYNALGYSCGLPLCLTKVRSSRARCPATALYRIFDPKHRLLFRIASLDPKHRSE